MRFRMQKSFVVKKSVDLSGGYDEKGKNRPNFLIRPGDVVVFDAANGNNLTIYRNDTIAMVMRQQSPILIETLIKNGMLDEIKKSPVQPAAVSAPAPVAPPVEIKPPEPKSVEKPKPQKKPTEAKAIATGSTKEDSTKFGDSAI
jgi:hypothetical protein